MQKNWLTCCKIQVLSWIKNKLLWLRLWYTNLKICQFWNTLIEGYANLATYQFNKTSQFQCANQLTCCRIKVLLFFLEQNQYELVNYIVHSWKYASFEIRYLKDMLIWQYTNLTIHINFNTKKLTYLLQDPSPPPFFLDKK